MSEEDPVEEIKRRKMKELVASGGSEALDEPVEIDAPAELADLLDEHPVVLVDCYADWCGPCQQLAPVVADLAAETDAAVAKVDADRHQGLTGEWGVRALPTLLLFADGEEADRFTGVQSYDRLKSVIEQHAPA